MTHKSIEYSSAKLRQMFLNYFQQHGHQGVPSSSLVPHNDPTLLFTNAGMVQFKNAFLGLEQPSCSRVTSVQRCVRAGGKHNDLDQVGYTARHHTFFEMLGNFSFGDYFKREAIQLSWNFLTQVLGLPAERLWVTVYEKDEIAADIWLKEMKIDSTRFSRCGEKDNFWAMGDTGPCGPCSEIFYDHGAHIAGGPPGSPEQDGDRYVEIWNLVFMQYDRLDSGDLEPLPKPSVDTGMGLERLAAVMQGVHNNYDTDIFVGLIKAIAQLTHTQDLTHTSMRVIADHIRACSFLIADGVFPSNEGRGYVLRRIIRRAIRHGYHLGLEEAFFYRLVPTLVNLMGEAYPELVRTQSIIEKALLQEEQQFAKTLEQGLRILEQDIASLSDTLIPGTTVFRLYDTFGFPPDLTADIARERGLQLDWAGFDMEMNKQRQLGQSKNKFDIKYSDSTVMAGETSFTGYENIEEHAEIEAIFDNKNQVSMLEQDMEGIIILKSTPFYAESGGQVGDQGVLLLGNYVFKVIDTKKHGKSFAHYGKVENGEFKVGDKILASVDKEKRQATVLNHSATHLLHAALRQLLGQEVMQKGSLVEPKRLRFDFSYSEPLSSDELVAVEDLVNDQIRANFPIQTHIMTPAEANAEGAMALFGEKYDDKVRVLQMGHFSKELCGGTHAAYTGNIGLFKITSESGVAAGIRRIEAVTGKFAVQWVRQHEFQLHQVAALLKTKVDQLLPRLNQLLERSKQQEKEIEQLRVKMTMGSSDLLPEPVEINGIKVISLQLEGADAKTLRQAIDRMKDKFKSLVVVLGNVIADKVVLVAGVSKELTPHFKAGELVNYVAAQVGGKGGGRADLAEAGGTKPEALAGALASVFGWVKERA